MIVIENTLISLNLVDQYFCCDLDKCKGVCCLKGDNGAPLEKEEISSLENIFFKIRPYLTDQSIKSIEHYGPYIEHSNGDYYTQLIEGRECAYAVCKNDGVWQCVIETAFHQGVITFQKPISCHLYPVRIHKYRYYDALNYDRWYICNGACELGMKHNLLLYQFLQKPLTRKYGKQWYENLEQTIQQFKIPIVLDKKISM